MKLIKISLFALCFVVMHLSYALQSEHLVWEKVPLTIELPINKERLVQFPQAIKVIDQQLSANLDILKVKGSLYLKAKESFKDSRLIVQLLPEGEVIILNLNANEKAINATPIEILIDDPKTTHNAGASQYEYNAIQLTRFAIQALYSPERVREIPEGIYRSPMQTNKTIPLFYGASIEAHPLASWRGGNLYVTAVDLKNLLNQPSKLQFTKLMGHWQTASFYPKSELPPRNQHESTTVFLISDQPFASALIQHTRYSR
ncbi:TPA: TIGR03749 family integrating conjugative element protein [Legionella pneumophila]|uniref:TIGR03749 family integrating conjugative element protein n=1 Tax=Legionella pneumophila TaxID=446 RepID=UPI0007782066|nr:TIGR03749 family integrating conjugative element protein [Legionella pneumophila]HAT4451861.1 TIGR03749 family integrating conjugative element protein [Legionella pneumophila]HAU9896933.1 TIGR03749 family integrating conjugative element protein [Legionella pneumophila]HAV0965829.1 TIGR03749 family integrating conjugative element protein [Legionella pneumophila]HAV0994076.1 TIGR03749 family integrating conjugative element protein [Legionella pneumophila]HAV1108637.1 TIGR03749 family integrat